MKKTLLVLLTISLISCIRKEEKEIEIQRDTSTSKIDSINSELKLYKNQFTALKHLSSGPFKYMKNTESDVYGENYRVEIYLYDIYKSVYISHVEYYGEGLKRISSQTKLDFEKMTGISGERTNGIEFNKWNGFNRFELKVGEQIYEVDIKNPHEFILVKT